MFLLFRILLLLRVLLCRCVLGTFNTLASFDKVNFNLYNIFSKKTIGMKKMENLICNKKMGELSSFSPKNLEIGRFLDCLKKKIIWKIPLTKFCKLVFSTACNNFFKKLMYSEEKFVFSQNSVRRTSDFKILIFENKHPSPLFID